MAAFAGQVGFLTPNHEISPAASVKSAAAGLQGSVARNGVAGGASVIHERFATLHSCVQAAFATCLCGMLVRSATHPRRPGGRRPAKALRVTSLDKAAAPLAKSELDSVESSIAQFVPKISALQNQAELLRSGELQNVIGTMKELRKTELRGVFGEVDQLLCALVEAIDGLRESAQSIRKSELKKHFEHMDQHPEVVAARDPTEEDAAQLVGGIDTMMEVHVIGLSHHKAPVEVREKLAVPEAEWNRYAQELVDFARTPQGYAVPEVAVLSTCNRFELYFASPELKKFAAVECVQAFLRHKSGLNEDELSPFLFQHSGGSATNHLFEVSSGLDSLVLGEAQILAQVKACHEHCIEKFGEDEQGVPGSGGKIIAKMLNAGIRMGKLVRTKTKIGKGSVSVSSAAVELMMSKSMNDLKKYAAKLHVAIIGAGKMSRLLLLALFSKNPDIQVTLVNRSVENAQAVLDDDLVAARGGSNAKVAPLGEMWDVIGRADVVFTATGAKEPIITPDDLQDRERNLMIVDISVPLNVARGCEEVPGVSSYNVDDLKKVVQANAEKRQSEVLKAKRLIDGEVSKFKVWQASQGAVPYLAALQSMAERIRRAETEKMSLKLQGLHHKEQEAVDKLTRHIVDQLFRPIYYAMKDDEEIEAKRSKIWALKEMFRLEPEYKRRVLPEGNRPPQLGA